MFENDAECIHTYFAKDLHSCLHVLKSPPCAREANSAPSGRLLKKSDPTAYFCKGPRFSSMVRSFPLHASVFTAKNYLDPKSRRRICHLGHCRWFWCFVLPAFGVQVSECCWLAWNAWSLKIVASFEFWLKSGDHLLAYPEDSSESFQKSGVLA